MAIAKGPLQTFINYALLLKQFYHYVELPVHVTQRDELFCGELHRHGEASVFRPKRNWFWINTLRCDHRALRFGDGLANDLAFANPNGYESALVALVGNKRFIVQHKANGNFGRLRRDGFRGGRSWRCCVSVGGINDVEQTGKAHENCARAGGQG